MGLPVDMIIRAKLGPVPLPYVFLIVLIPLWTPFSSSDRSLLLSLCLIITTILKGSLFSYWIQSKVSSCKLQIILLFGVNVLQIILIDYSLNSSVIPFVFLVPPSTLTGVCIFVLHLDVVGQDDQPFCKKAQRRSVIVICSRSTEEEYQWLSESLNRVGKVVSFHITNNNSQQFRQQVSQSTFAILYHSKTRGRVNITNVTDSLYDKEVEYMSKTLGSQNVLVVADDMDDSSSETRDKILNTQVSIRNLTRGVILFTTPEKMNSQLIREKMQPIIDILYKGSTSHIITDLILVFLITAPWFYFVSAIYNLTFLMTSNIGGSFLLYYATSSSNSGMYTMGLAAVLVLVVAELSTLFWISSIIDMVLLLAQSVGTGAFAVKLVLF